jgi:hypothetical protein
VDVARRATKDGNTAGHALVERVSLSSANGGSDSSVSLELYTNLMLAAPDSCNTLLTSGKGRAEVCRIIYQVITYEWSIVNVTFFAGNITGLIMTSAGDIAGSVVPSLVGIDRQGDNGNNGGKGS